MYVHLVTFRNFKIRCISFYLKGADMCPDRQIRIEHELDRWSQRSFVCLFLLDDRLIRVRSQAIPAESYCFLY